MIVIAGHCDAGKLIFKQQRAMISGKLLIPLVPKVRIIVKNKFTEKFRENIFAQYSNL